MNIIVFQWLYACPEFIRENLTTEFRQADLVNSSQRVKIFIMPAYRTGMISFKIEFELQ